MVLVLQKWLLLDCSQATLKIVKKFEGVDEDDSQTQKQLAE